LLAARKSSLNNVATRSNKLPHKNCAPLLGLLAEGNTLRAASRLSDTPLNNCEELVAEAGAGITAYQDRTIRNLAWRRIEIQVVWSFAYTRRKSRSHRNELDFSYGDVWTWVAIDTETKFVILWLVAGRDVGYASDFIEDLRFRIGRHGRLSIDGGRVLLENGEDRSALDVEYRKLLALYGPIPEGETPGRENIAGRIGLRGLAGLTNAFSKKVESYAHAITLHYMHYNFCRVHDKLRVTPAMAAGVADRRWSIGDVASVWEAWEGNRRSAAVKALQEEKLRMEALKRAAELSMTEFDLEKFLQSITDTGVSMTGAQYGVFFENVISKRGGESYMLSSLSGVPRESFSKFPMPRNTHLFEPIFRGTAIIRSSDITGDRSYGQNPPYRGMPKGHLPIKSYLAVPVVSRSGNVLGGLFFGHSEARAFNQRHEELLVVIAALASLGIDNVHHFQPLLQIPQSAKNSERL
jgi:hypothetical protein